MPNPTRPDLGTILADMRDTGLKWLADAADTIEQALTPGVGSLRLRGQRQPAEIDSEMCSKSANK